jgi:hypothetical protein
MANYRLQVDMDLVIDSLNYLPDTVFQMGDKQIFDWHKTDFMPDRDFEVYLELSTAY